MSIIRRRQFKRRKKGLSTGKKKMLILDGVLLLVFFLGMGFSVLGTDLSLTGDVGVKKYVDPTLYNVLKSAAEEGTYAKEYTGPHQDSMAGVGSEKIYHWWTKNSNDTEILNRNNVIFAGQCWQMIRTTDTGGVKMIYNGEPADNKCIYSNERHAGYTTRLSTSLSTTYYYGTKYIYDKTKQLFSLSGTITTGNINLGEYTCKKTSENGTCSTLYLVNELNSGSNYYVMSLNSVNGNSPASQFGTLQYNTNYNSLADVGYMYNTRYISNLKNMSNTETMFSSASLATTYWYADSITWGSPTENNYNLNSPYQVSTTSDYPNLVGKYTFRSTSQTTADFSVYYIAGVNNTTMYYIQLNNSGNHTLADFDSTYTYGDSYTDNGNGTYTINNANTINKSDWYTSYSNVGAGKYVCKNATNNTCSDLWYTISTFNTIITYIKVADVYKYAKGFTWDGTKYVLDNDTSVSSWNIIDSTNNNSINNAHYTCWNETGECTTISYIYYIDIDNNRPYYIDLSNGKSIEDAKNEMLYNNNVNTINSTIKTGIDAWYKNYLLEDYDNYIEDTIFCNDRRQRNNSTNGWNPDGGSITEPLIFSQHSDEFNLFCSNETDRFSVNNNKAKLTYKVGLMSFAEIKLIESITILAPGQDYWLGTPCNFQKTNPSVFMINSVGSSYYTVNSAYGVRPAISLATGTKYTSGDGSRRNPYIVDTN